MTIRTHAAVWSAAALLAAVTLAGPARAQTPLDLSAGSGTTAGGAVWTVKDVGTDFSTAAAAKVYADDTAANGWKSASVPGDLSASTGTGDVADNSNYWYRVDGIKIPADWPKDRYLVLTGFNVDDSDTTYFNGVEIGSHSGAADIRTYIVPPSIVDFGGTNSIAIFGQQGTGAAGITTSAPTLQPADTSTGVVLVKVTNPTTKKPSKNVLITTQNPDGTSVDTLTDSSGQIVYSNLTPGTFPVTVQSYPWVGSITPTGTQNLTVTGGQLTELDLSVNPFVYTVARAAAPIVIDGNITGPEWAGAMTMECKLAKQLAVGPTMWGGVKDSSGTAKWKWDDTYIYLAADVVDDVRANSHIPDAMTDGSMWQGDGFETYIQLDPYDAKRSAYMIDRNYQWTIGVAPDDAVSWKIFRATSTPNDILIPGIPDPTGNVKVISHPKASGDVGYTIEARFPWASLPDVNKALIPPKIGTMGAIALAINDADDPMDVPTVRKTQLSWNSRADMWQNPSSFSPAIWADVPPATTAVLGDLNADGKVDLKDATLSLQIAVGNLPGVTAAQKTADDVNKDGKQDLKDTTLILEAAVGLIKLM